MDRWMGGRLNGGCKLCSMCATMAHEHKLFLGACVVELGGISQV